MALAAFLRFYSIADESLWADEATSYFYAKLSLGEYWNRHHRPQAYYFLLHYWIAFGQSEFVLRSFSAVFGILTIPLIFGLGKTIGNTRIGLLAALLLAVSPFHIQYGQEARGYALLTFGATLSMWAMAWLFNNAETASIPLRRLFFQPSVSLRAANFDTGRARAAWVTFAVATVLSLYTHDTFVFFLVATNLAFGICYLYQRRSWHSLAKNWALVQLGIVLLWSFVWLGLFRDTSDVLRGFWISFTPLRAMLQSLTRVFYFADHASLGQLGEVVVNYTFFGLALLGLTTWIDKKWAIIFCLAFTFTAPMGEYLVSALIVPIYLKKSIIWASIPFIIMLSAGLAKIRNPILLSALLCTLLAGYLWADVRYYHSTRKADWKSAVGYVAERFQPDDLIVLAPVYAQLPFNYYTDQYFTVKAGISQQTHKVNFRNADFIEEMRPSISNVDRVWFIARISKRRRHDINEILNVLKMDYSLIDQYHPNKMGVYLFQSDSPHRSTAAPHIAYRIKPHTQATQAVTESQRDLQQSWGAVVDFLADRIKPEDLIMLNPDYAGIHLNQHWRHPSMPLRVHYVNNKKTDYMDLLKSKVADQKRVWLISTGGAQRHGKAKEAILNYMQTHFSIIDQYHPSKIGVYLFESDPPHWEAAARYIAGRIKPRDLIVLSPGSAGLSLGPYTGGILSLNPVYYVENASEAFIDELKAATLNRRRIWFVSVGTQSRQTRIKQHIIRLLEANYTLTAQYHPYKIAVFLFDSSTKR